MKHNTISLRRRHLVIAGLAGVAAPATLFAGSWSGTSRAAVAELGASGSRGKEKMVVSGRIIGPDCKPLAGATVEVWNADANGNRASVTTDADGRFMFATIAPAEYPGRPPHIHYRVTHQGHETRVTQLHFARARGVSEDLIAQLQRDDRGVWRATFGRTLA